MKKLFKYLTLFSLIFCLAFLTSACGQDKIYYTVNKIDNVNIYIEKDGRLIKNQNGSLNKDQEFYVWLVIDDGFVLSEDFSVLINGNSVSMTKYDGNSYKSNSIKMDEDFTIDLQGEIEQTGYIIENITFSCEDEILKNFMLRFDNKTMEKLSLDNSISLLDFKDFYQNNDLKLIYNYGDEMELYLYSPSNAYNLDLALTDTHGKNLYNYGKGYNSYGELQFSIWFISQAKNIVIEFK